MTTDCSLVYLNQRLEHLNLARIITFGSNHSSNHYDSIGNHQIDTLRYNKLALSFETLCYNRFACNHCIRSASVQQC